MSASYFPALIYSYCILFSINQAFVESDLIEENYGNSSLIKYQDGNTDEQTSNKDLVLGEIIDINSEENESTQRVNNRNPVKLTMKQGLIMNQVINTYALSDVKDTACQNHINEFKVGLRAFEPWALKMFDSSSKLMSGILNGNLAEMGAFTPCLNIHEETPHGIIKGQHCSLKITPSDRLMEIILRYRNVSKKRFELLKKNVMDGIQLTWSVCVPHTCSHLDVWKHYNKIILETTQGLNLTVHLEKEHCISSDALPDFSTGDFVLVFIVAMNITIVLICTAIHIIKRENSAKLVQVFSLKSNWLLLVSTKSNPDEIKCLHGLKFLSMCYILAGHRYIHNMAGAVSNSMDLVDWLQEYFSTTVFGGTTSVDTFFVVASTLLSYNFFLTVDRTKKFNIIMFYLLRNLRMFVPLALAVGAYGTVIKHFGSGPFYNDFIRAFQEPCNFFWWSTLLHLQGLINSDCLCVVQTWYLSVDMFWYYLAPLILVPIWKNKSLGLIIYVSAYIFSVLINFYFAWTKKFDGSMPVTSVWVMAGWTLTTLIMISTILISHIFHDENFVYNRVFSSLFISLHRSVWTVSLMWIIWSCEKGHGGIVNDILSSGIFKVLGRLGYTIFLFHYFFQGAMQSSQKTPGYFSNFLSIYMACADIVFMTFLCTPICLCFEYPFLRLVSLWLKKREGLLQTSKVQPFMKRDMKV